MAYSNEKKLRIINYIKSICKEAGFQVEVHKDNKWIKLWSTDANDSIKRNESHFVIQLPWHLEGRKINNDDIIICSPSKEELSNSYENDLRWTFKSHPNPSGKHYRRGYNLTENHTTDDSLLDYLKYLKKYIDEHH